MAQKFSLEKKETLKKISSHLAGKKEILFAYLYGSTAREEEREDSDMDLAIFLEDTEQLEDPLFEAKIALELERLVDRSMDVKVINGASFIFVYQVLKHGVLLFSRDERTRINFETLNLDKYFDFLPLMEEYDRKRLERYGIK